MSKRWLVLVGVVAVVGIVVALTRGGDDGGGSDRSAQAPPKTSTTRPKLHHTANGQPLGAGCDAPPGPVLELIAGKSTDLVDFTPAQSTKAPNRGLVVSAPIRPANPGATVATWLVAGPNVVPANAAARDQSSFKPAPVPASARPAIARAEACVQAVLPVSRLP
jgi:hypothetical protein